MSRLPAPLLFAAFFGTMAVVVTLTARGQTERSPSSSSADGARSFPRSVNAATTLTERGVGDVRTDTTPSVHGDRLTRDVGRPPLTPRSVNVAYHRSYKVDWRRRYRREHRHVQRLLDQLRRARHVQAHHKSAGGAGATDWRARQIAAAETIGREADTADTDPWPNCPDPYDHGGATWDDTVACENSGDWMDSPGFYRCGLQLDPRWEQRFGRMCP